MPSLPSLTIGKHTSRLPIVQGGMGVGISGHRLAGAVAREGGVGTLTAIGLPNVPAFAAKFSFFDQDSFYKATQACVAEEIRLARRAAGNDAATGAPRPVFINLMAAAGGYRQQVEAALEAGVDGIVTGAGLPPEFLLEMAKDFPSTVLVPILSASRGVQMILRKWERQGRLPDAIVLEDPSTAGGHLGANKGLLENVDAAETKTEVAVPETLKFLDSKGLKIPVIAAGGIVDRADVDRVLALGAAGAQIGTRFLASEESAAHAKFKEAIVAAKTPADLKVYQSSAMLPARAVVSSPVFPRIRDDVANPSARVEGGGANLANCRMNANCLQACALRDGHACDGSGNAYAQMCLLEELARVTEFGDGEGLYFTGTSALRIDTVKSVRQIMAELSGETA